ncbi:MAG TPA: fumarylacetoacetate hydrolase family protein [Cyclobacteriaceae bacterium]|nr:fumarylacetoacetate hydrolase family protein [Cyclobacteriaceae bacterium]
MEYQKAASLKSWVQVPNQSDFTIQNLPFGIFRNKRLTPRVGIAIGDKIVDLSALQEAGFFQDIKLEDDIFLQDSLNPFIALGKSTTRKVRDRVQHLLNEENSDLKDHQSRGKIMVGLKEAEMMKPIKIGDCIAFTSPAEQLLFKDKAESHLLSQQLVPLESQRKVSTIVPTGVSIFRPKGPVRTPTSASLEFASTRQLDFELELAYVVGKSSRMGEGISASEGEEFIFGLILFNDWTARDIEVEGKAASSPLLSKNFASSISPWVVTLDALEPFRIASSGHSQELLPYLLNEGENGFDIHLEASIKSEKGAENAVCHTNYRYATWTAPQMLAQQTVNGSNVEIGDLLATGAFSNPLEGQYSSLSELYNHASEFSGGGIAGEFIKDGDTVVIKGFCEKEGMRVGFGEIVTKILPTK